VALGDIQGHLVASVALGDIDLAFAWQAWHLWHWAGSWSALVAGDAAVFCVAGVALGDLQRHLAWQHLVTSTLRLRGRHGTCCTGLALVTRLVRTGRR